jgi:hypothetical protein
MSVLIIDLGPTPKSIGLVIFIKIILFHLFKKILTVEHVSIIFFFNLKPHIVFWLQVSRATCYDWPSLTDMILISCN